MEKLKVLDLFSGIGGFSYALDSTGVFETVAFCEINKLCHPVLKKNWPNVHIFHDVKGLTKKVLDEMNISVDVVCGGFPCQDISVAGKQKGIIEGRESSLFFELMRIVNEVKPKFLILENVRNLLNIGFKEVLEEIAKSGYDAFWQVVSAREVGATHKRERLYILAYSDKMSQRGDEPPDRLWTKPEMSDISDRIQSFIQSHKFPSGKGTKRSAHEPARLIEKS